MSYVLGAADDITVTDSGDSMTFAVPRQTDTSTSPATTGGASWITPEMAKQFGSMAAAAGMSLAAFISTFFPALAAQQQQQAEQQRRAREEAAKRSSFLSTYGGPLLLLGGVAVVGTLAFQASKRRRTAAA